MQSSRPLRIAFALGVFLIGGAGLLGGGSAAYAGLLLWGLALFLLWLKSVLELKQVVDRSAGLPEREILRNALRFPMRVRAVVDGHPLLVYGSAFGTEVEIELPGVEDVAYTSYTLAALARVDVALSAPARVLFEAGVSLVALRRGKLRIGGGSGPLEPLVQASLALVGSPAALRARPSGPGACPYCHQPVSFVRETAHRCPDCDALHHSECWGEHGGCAVFACARSPRERKPSLPAQAKGKA